MDVDRIIEEFSEVELIRQEAVARRHRLGGAVYHNRLTYADAIKRTGQSKDAIAAMVMDYRLREGLPARPKGKRAWTVK